MGSDDTGRDARREQAAARVQKRRGMQVAIGVFIIVNVALWVIWALNDRDQPGVPWPVYVTVVWGAILAFIIWRNRTNDDAAIELGLERMDRDS